MDYTLLENFACKEKNMFEKIIRLLKRLDAWVLDLLFPNVDQDDDPPRCL